MRYATLCSGIEGFGLGFDASGMECVFQCERDEKCLAVLARHYPCVERTNDVESPRTEDALCRLRPDLIAFGFPCQDLSVAGRRAGLAGERSGLFYRCAGLVEAARPEWVVIENVPGLLSSNGGEDMAAVLGTLEELGYGVAYRVLDAQHFGVAQRRRRVFVVGRLGDWRSPARVLFEPESLLGNPPPSRTPGQGAAGPTARGARSRRWHPDPAYCLTAARGAGDGHGQGWNSNYVAEPLAFDTTQITSASNYSRPKPGDPCHPLAAGAHAPTIAYQCHGNNVGPMGTLRQGNGGLTGGVPFIVNAAESCAKKDRARQSETARCIDGTGSFATNQGGTVVATAFHMTQDPISGSISPALGAGSAQGCATIGVAQAMRVRRLTPTECERLQSFPDGWTAAGLKVPAPPGLSESEWLDWVAENLVVIKNSHRYRMLGNAVCVAVSRWLGRRITEVAGA